MRLSTYLNAGGKGAAAALAKKLRVKPVLICQWRKHPTEKGWRQVPAERCPEIEKATGGAVRCEDLRADVDWAYLRASGNF